MFPEVRKSQGSNLAFVQRQTHWSSIEQEGASLTEQPVLTPQDTVPAEGGLCRHRSELPALSLQRAS